MLSSALFPPLSSAGTSISCYATNRRARLLGYAEKGLSPRIFIHDLLTHELVRCLIYSVYCDSIHAFRLCKGSRLAR